MKKLILSLILFVSVIASFAQSGSVSYSGVFTRVNDTTAYQSAAATKHAQGYADHYYNNQATTKHWDFWNGSSYTHVFDFNSGSGSTPTLQEVLTEGAVLTTNNTISGTGTNPDLAITNFGNIDLGTLGDLRLNASIGDVEIQGGSNTRLGALAGGYFNPQSGAANIIYGDKSISVSTDVTLTRGSGQIKLPGTLPVQDTAAYVLAIKNSDKSIVRRAVSSIGSGGGAAAFTFAAIAYVDANGDDGTGTLGRIDKPFETIDAALDAGVAVTSLHIKLGMGTFAKPTASKLRANLWLEGSGKPNYNWAVSHTVYETTSITDPTKLIGGTIINGGLEFVDKGGIHITDLGIDNGPDYVNGGGTQSNCIGIGSATTTYPFPMITNIVIRNVTVLGYSTSSAFHGVIIENGFQPFIENIDTYFHTHGIVYKCNGGLISNVRSQRHATSSIFFRSNDYAPSYSSYLVNFEIRNGAGLKIEAVAQPNASLTISNGQIFNSTTTGVVMTGAPGFGNLFTKISDVRVKGSASHGFDITGTEFIQMSDCYVLSAVGTGYILTAAATSRSLSISNCVSIGSATGFNLSGGGSGGYVWASDCKADFSTGFGFVLGSQVIVGNLGGTGNGSGLTSGTIVSNQFGSTSFGTAGASVLTPSAVVDITGLGTTTDLILTGKNSSGTERIAVESNGELRLSGSGGTSGQVLTSAGANAPPTWTSPSGGITNGAANNELMKSNGTNAVASGFFSSGTSALTFGSASISDAVKTFSVINSTSDAAFSFSSQGAATFAANGTTALTLNPNSIEFAGSSATHTVKVNHGSGSFRIDGRLDMVLLSGTSLTLNDDDHRGKVIYCTSSSAVTITVPSGLPLGFNCVIVQDHATGTVTLSTSGTTVKGKTATTGDGDSISLLYYKSSEAYIGF